MFCLRCFPGVYTVNDKLGAFKQKWQMRFNHDKCKVIYIGKEIHVTITYQIRKMGKTDMDLDFGCYS